MSLVQHGNGPLYIILFNWFHQIFHDPIFWIRFKLLGLLRDWWANLIGSGFCFKKRPDLAHCTSTRVGWKKFQPYSGGRELIKVSKVELLYWLLILIHSVQIFRKINFILKWYLKEITWRVFDTFKLDRWEEPSFVAYCSAPFVFFMEHYLRK